jgi:hypothetical protein
MLPELPFEANAKADISRFKSMLEQAGQTATVELERTKSSNFSLHLLHSNSYMGIPLCLLSPCLKSLVYP